MNKAERKVKKTTYYYIAVLDKHCDQLVRVMEQVVPEGNWVEFPDQGYYFNELNSVILYFDPDVVSVSKAVEIVLKRTRKELLEHYDETKRILGRINLVLDG